MDTCITERPSAPFDDEGVDMDTTMEDSAENDHRRDWPISIYIAEGLSRLPSDSRSTTEAIIDHQKRLLWYILPEESYEFAASDEDTDSDCSSMLSTSSSSSEEESSGEEEEQQTQRQRRRRESSSSDEVDVESSYDSMASMSQQLNESNDMVVIPSTVLDLIKNSQ